MPCDLRDWVVVMGSGALAIGGSIADKQMDEGVGDTSMLTGLGVTCLKAVIQLRVLLKEEQPVFREGKVPRH